MSVTQAESTGRAPGRIRRRHDPVDPAQLQFAQRTQQRLQGEKLDVRPSSSQVVDPLEVILVLDADAIRFAVPIPNAGSFSSRSDRLVNTWYWCQCARRITEKTSLM